MTISELADKLVELNAAYSYVDDSEAAWAWLNDFNPSQALVVCLGAGPWKEGRRKAVQSHALRALGSSDIADCNPQNLGFPLQWQYRKVAFLIEYLRTHFAITERPMDKFFFWLQSNPRSATSELYKATGSSGRAKVLDLYARDYLNVPSFPIDRHVHRVLRDAGLPLKEDTLVAACYHADLDPRKVARRLVGHTVSNPDLSDVLEEICAEQ